MALLQDKIAIVTGGSRGIGRAIAVRFAAAGAKVVLTGRSLESAGKVAEEIRAQGGEAVAQAVNAAVAEEVEGLIKSTVDRFGRLDILVNNAGITRDNLLVRMRGEEWQEVLDTNLTGVFNHLRAASRVMIRQRSGKIINITSIVALMGNKGQANYCAAKAGVIGLTKSAARELASRNIQVNAVAPGFIDTDMTAVLGESVRETLLQSIPLGRLGTPGEVAGLVLFLASPEADYITGQVINIDGGMVMA
ncbi:MAG: 3-oxoacyl-[acyl-carrier-protein] reductase [candidate division KSB1 bacterium]|nr:3-oxoacyl-[acyl-carrier-protein] reductase [candidate division KSB1 bacterium]MDZ7272465.1 3-oxoacyl-[acyl-carrier-protein] reductase [candidate division KSB1 bacterium]MDZ7284511.1 3-oxoacyl-[acyl-carrier-protein] reductase [candidate division KSB1 bacterium]MDZ7297093.1 3-oxoacyl-[acyl-carrier-protein] reductase [candidate division KSB1 bacterium]MDZ7306133.1 3-oxoacyl-[acyl-carrier-protein] reductase [candidate division KSB1 bacterium]